MSINFDFDDLAAFVAVSETGSFHLAARKLALSQSAVTRRIQKLETALDSLLFERTTRHVKPTLAAKRLLARAEAILEDARETTRAMRDDSVAFAYQRNLVITVAIIPTVVAALVPKALRAFRGAGNDSRIRLIDAAANEVSDAVASGDADFGVTSMPSLDPGLAFETLLEDDMGLALSPGHSLAASDRVRWTSLDRETLILPARKTGNRVLIDDALARAGGGVRWTFEVERSTTALSLVAGGAGVAILPRSAVRSVHGSAVVWRPLDDPRIARPIGLLNRASPSGSDEVGALMQAIRTTCAEMQSLSD